MAKGITRKSHQQLLMQTWWVRAILAAAFILIAYGFASLAINSGSLWQYALAVIFVWWALVHAVRSVRLVF